MSGILKILLLISLPLSALSSQIPAPQTPQPPHSSTLLVRWEPSSPVNGSLCILRVRSDQPLKSLSGTWQGHKVFFDFDATSMTWYGLAGVGIDTISGQHQLALEATLTSGVRILSNHPVLIGRANYRSIALSVPRKFTEPGPEMLARINQEKMLKNEVFGRITKDRLWEGRFIAPVNGIMTEGYGTERTFNRIQQTVHLGSDFRADTGTYVGAMNSGTVLIAREMFYEGGFVVIDHGQGLLTLYMHLSEINVREGDAVKGGQTIGLSGATGRVTGPHLHIGVKWQGIYVNPASLLMMEMANHN